MSAILALSLLFAHFHSHAQITKIYYAPLKGDFVVLQAQYTADFDNIHPLSLTVYVGPAERVVKQNVTDREGPYSSNLYVYLNSGPVLIFKTRDPYGMPSRFVYAPSSYGKITDAPFDELIELETDEFDLSHRLTLVDLDVFKNPANNAAGPTVQSVLDCAKRLANP